MNTKIKRSSYLAAMAVWISCNAHAEIFKCPSKTGGMPEYVNNAEVARARECQSLSLPERPDENDWKYITESTNMVVYGSRNPLLAEGQLLKAWSLFVYKDQRTMRSGTPYRSVKTLTLHDCKTRTSADRQHVYYPDLTGNGRPVYTLNLRPEEIEFADPVPNSISDALLERVCSKIKR